MAAGGRAVAAGCDDVSAAGRARGRRGAESVSGRRGPGASGQRAGGAGKMAAGRVRPPSAPQPRALPRRAAPPHGPARRGRHSLVATGDRERWVWVRPCCEGETGCPSEPAPPVVAALPVGRVGFSLRGSPVLVNPPVLSAVQAHPFRVRVGGRRGGEGRGTRAEEIQGELV